MASLPGGTVTFLFTDIEGSTRLLQELGDGYGDVVRDHRQLLREHLGDKGGTEVDTQGDAFFYSFSRARDAVAGAVAAQRALGEHGWPAGAEVRVRMGLHTGEPSVGDEGYLGLDVVRAARICSAGHGGQMHERIYQLALDDGPESFPPLKSQPAKSASDALGERIERHVEEMIEQSFKSGKSGKPRDTLRMMVVGLVELVLVVLTILVIIWLVRHIL